MGKLCRVHLECILSCATFWPDFGYILEKKYSSEIRFIQVSAVKIMASRKGKRVYNYKTDKESESDTEELAEESTSASASQSSSRSSSGSSCK